MEASAEPGGILIGHETLSLTKDIVMAEEQSPFTVKGFNKPIHCHKLVGIYDELLEKRKIIRKVEDGVRVTVDLTKRDNSGPIRVLEEVLSQLKMTGDNQGKSSATTKVRMVQWWTDRGRA